MKYVKIPRDRIAVLVGNDGETKEAIEEHGVELDVDSETGDVAIRSDDAVVELDAQSVVRAIGRGFSPEHALHLFKDDYYFELLDMRDYVGKKGKDVQRIAGRVIGKNGRSRRIIEELTGAFVSVYGTTVGLIGQPRGLDVALEAVRMLLNGANHATVYGFLEKEKKRMKLEEFGLR
ncbi:MAG: KH domain-containing protein [Thermoplasmatota archaeon]